MGVVFLLFILVASLNSAVKLWKQRAVLTEFKVSQVLALAVVLYPVGMAGFVLLPNRMGLVVAIAVGLAAFLPGIVLARRAQHKLQRSGTDRTRTAEALAARVAMTGVGGILYFAVVIGISLAAQYSSGSALR